MNEIDQIRAEIETLRKGLLNMRADLAAYRMLTSASLIAMTGNARNALQQNFRTLSEQAMAAGLANSRSTDDSTLHAMQAAIDRVSSMLADLPSS